MSHGDCIRGHLLCRCSLFSRKSLQLAIMLIELSVEVFFSLATSIFRPCQSFLRIKATSLCKHSKHSELDVLFLPFFAVPFHSWVLCVAHKVVVIHWRCVNEAVMWLHGGQRLFQMQQLDKTLCGSQTSINYAKCVWYAHLRQCLNLWSICLSFNVDCRAWN